MSKIRIQTVRSQTMLVEKLELWPDYKAQPKYSVGDYLQVYSGSYEGHYFWVKARRFNHDIQKFEYLYDGTLMGGWYPEGCVVPA